MNVDYRRAQSTAASGQNLVEFAILLPILMLIAFGVLDLGRLFHGAVSIAGAARAGARYGAMHLDEFADPLLLDRFGTVEAAVIAEAAGSGISLSDPALSEIVISCPPDDSCGAGLPLRVEITHTMSLILPGFFASPEVPVYSYAEFMVP
jgi:hypothetical protein